MNIKSPNYGMFDYGPLNTDGIASPLLAIVSDTRSSFRDSQKGGCVLEGFLGGAVPVGLPTLLSDRITQACLDQGPV